MIGGGDTLPREMGLSCLGGGSSWMGDGLSCLWGDCGGEISSLNDGIRRGGDCACGGGENFRMKDSGLSAFGTGDSGGVGVLIFCTFGGDGDLAVKSNTGDDALSGGDWRLMTSGDSTRGGVGVFILSGGLSSRMNCSSRSGDSTLGDGGGVGVFSLSGGDSTLGGVGVFIFSGGDSTRGGVGVLIFSGGGDSILGGVGVFVFSSGDSTRGGVGVFSLSGGDSTRGGVGVLLFIGGVGSLMIGDAIRGGVGVFVFTGSGGGDSILYTKGGVTSLAGGEYFCTTSTGAIGSKSSGDVCCGGVGVFVFAGSGGGGDSILGETITGGGDT
jgi:hypothetical protein